MEQIKNLQKALKELWPKIPREERESLEEQAAEGHEYLLSIRNQTVGDRPLPVPREVLLLHSVLHDDPDGLLRTAVEPEGLLTHVGKDGQVYFGGVKYDSTDPLWLYTIWAWYETGHTKEFVYGDVVIPIPDNVTLALVGDWGGNNSPARKVASAIKAQNVDYVVHLGDVYYAGTNQHGEVERNYQQEHFLDPWPGRAGKSFNLNSNHDMYAHAVGYYDTALASEIFSAQKGCSYFALHNSGFRFVGLDTAYFDPDKNGRGFLDGTLDPRQEKFLNEQAAAAAKANQDFVLLTHHNGLSIDGETPLPLWNQVSAQLAPLAGKQVIWYWGHEHLAAVYQPQTAQLPQKAGTVTILPRCCGHGCIPWGIPTDLVYKSQVEWYEKEVLGPGRKYFVTNGFATLKVDGTSVRESFFGQSGGPHWTS